MSFITKILKYYLLPKFSNNIYYQNSSIVFITKLYSIEIVTKNINL